MKNKTPIIISAVILVILLLILGIYFGFIKQSFLSQFKPKGVSTQISLISSDSVSARYSHAFTSDPFSKYYPIGCGDFCSYDFSVPISQASSSLEKVEGLQEGIWFEGVMTQNPDITMIYNYASDKEVYYTPIVNNTRIFLMKQGNDITARYTGDIYGIKNGVYMGGHIYGLSGASGEANILKEGIECLIDIHCNQGEECKANSCVEICVPQTCEDINKNCGVYSNGCLGSLNCGTCGEGFICSFGECVDEPPEPNIKLIMIIAISLIVIFLVIIAVVVVRRRK